MSFIKSFNDKGVWRDMSLTLEEEELAKSKAEIEHTNAMVKCLKEAKTMLTETGLKGNETDIAIALFNKITSHVQYHRENMAREKFEKLYGVRTNFVDHTR